jgi:hypothetical protein
MVALSRSEYFCWVAVSAMGLSLFSSAVDAAGKVSFEAEMRPLLADHCFKCHGPDVRARKGRPGFDTLENATKPNRRGIAPIVPGKPDDSEMIRRVSSDDATYRMPPSEVSAALKPEEIATLRRWIAEGAVYEPHWAYVRPRRPGLPKAKDATWPRNEIDRYVLARLEGEGLSPAREADALTLLRRLSLDLVGLPPTPEQVEAFVKDHGDAAYEAAVDALLASPRFGENWARVWLDLARYADTKGYEKDDPRTLWPFRDWVIRALNADMPYDQFTIEQLAGDLLPDPTEDQLIATGFHRNTMVNDEGGTDDEEFRVAAVIDRVNTTFSTWMATTIACAQCHDHKYDPISQREFYGAYAFLNQTTDADTVDEKPLLVLGSAADILAQGIARERVDALKAEVNHEKKSLEDITLAEADRVRLAEGLKAREAALAQARKEKSAIDGRITRVPILQEMPDAIRRETRLFNRGSFLSPSDSVEPGTPGAFPPFPPDLPKNRLGLAKWIVSRENPLTARVAVNRYWERFFGIGLVKTSEDFGMRSELPSHPELLDWLAVEFMDRGWSLKALCKTIVMSATYRQSSAETPESRERDPENRLLARGPRFRLDAETVRDSALQAAGLLSDKLYGPSVMPYQPDGVWNVVYSSQKWESSSGEDRYRRGVYTYTRRTSPYPSMVAFDAGSREVCLVRRVRTNTPLQALVMLNDPVYVEAAQALGRKMAAFGGGDLRKKAAYGFHAALSRPPAKAELNRLVALYEGEYARFRGDATAADAMATQPIGPLPEGLSAPEAAAWSTVANVLLNLDEFVTRR